MVEMMAVRPTEESPISPPTTTSPAAPPPAARAAGAVTTQAGIYIAADAALPAEH